MIYWNHAVSHQHSSIFSKPKGWDCPPVFNCSFIGVNWFILWNYFQCANWSFCLLTLNRDQSIDLPHRSGPTKCRCGTDVAITGIQRNLKWFFYPSPCYVGLVSNLPSYWNFPWANFVPGASCRKPGWLPMQVFLCEENFCTFSTLWKHTTMWHIPQKVYKGIHQEKVCSLHLSSLPAMNASLSNIIII